MSRILNWPYVTHVIYVIHVIHVIHRPPKFTASELFSEENFAGKKEIAHFPTHCTACPEHQIGD